MAEYDENGQPKPVTQGSSIPEIRTSVSNVGPSDAWEIPRSVGQRGIYNIIKEAATPEVGFATGLARKIPAAASTLGNFFKSGWLGTNSPEGQAAWDKANQSALRYTGDRQSPPAGSEAAGAPAQKPDMVQSLLASSHGGKEFVPTNPTNEGQRNYRYPDNWDAANYYSTPYQYDFSNVRDGKVMPPMYGGSRQAGTIPSEPGGGGFRTYPGGYTPPQQQQAERTMGGYSPGRFDNLRGTASQGFKYTPEFGPGTSGANIASRTGRAVEMRGGFIAPLTGRWMPERVSSIGADTRYGDELRARAADDQVGVSREGNILQAQTSDADRNQRMAEALMKDAQAGRQLNSEEIRFIQDQNTKLREQDIKARGDVLQYGQGIYGSNAAAWAATNRPTPERPDYQVRDAIEIQKINEARREMGEPESAAQDVLATRGLVYGSGQAQGGAPPPNVPPKQYVRDRSGRVWFGQHNPQTGEVYPVLVPPDKVPAGI